MSYYLENPVITATIFGADGVGYAMVSDAAVSLPDKMNPGDIGWMPVRLWDETGAPRQLPPSYAVDPETSEITLQEL